MSHDNALEEEAVDEFREQLEGLKSRVVCASLHTLSIAQMDGYVKWCYTCNFVIFGIEIGVAGYPIIGVPVSGVGVM